METASNQDGYRHEASLMTNLLGKAIEIAGDPIVICDMNESVIWVNSAFEKELGFLCKEVSGENIAVVLGIDDEVLSYRKLCGSRNAESAPVLWRRELRLRDADGNKIIAEEKVTVLCDDAGQIIHYVSVLHDLTSSDALLRKEQSRARQDALTGLAGREHLLEALQAGLHQANLGGSLIALLFIDLDGFKQLNDDHGHLVGDAMLRAVAARLQRGVRSTDTVGRFGGDEFIVVLPLLERRSTASEIASKLLDQLTQPFSLPSGCYSIGASLGLAFFPDHGTEAETLLARADQAMYAAKRRGGRQVSIAVDDGAAPGSAASNSQIPAMLTGIYAGAGSSVGGASSGEE